MTPTGPVPAELPPNEAERLVALRSLAILDTDAEKAFDDIVALAADLLDVPIALVSLIDEHRQWFKARVGLDAQETPRESAFCAHAILEPDQVFEVEDAQEDRRFAGNPLVLDDPNIRFYAGAPLRTSDGFALGTLCVIDRRPRKLDERAQRALRSLADQVAAQLELRRMVSLLDEQVAEEQTVRAALAAAEAQYRLLFQHSTDIISVWDRDFNWQYSSPAGLRLLGYEPDAVVGGVVNMIHPDDLPAVADAFEGVINGSRPPDEPFTCRIRSAGGEWRFLESVAVNLLDEPSIGGVVITSHDITDRLRDADALAAALQQAEEASQLKSDFLAVMSHEIRTPLNGVLGMTGVLLGTHLDDDQRELAEVVRRSGESLLVMLNDLLDLSKIEAGRVDLEIIDFELRPILRDVIDLSTDAAGSKGIALGSIVHGAVPVALRGDPFRIRQVLTNLVSNAVKFTSAGGVELRADVVEGDTGAQLRFAVTDTGIGIDPNHVGRLFEPFSQADASVTRRFGGTGLGLAICKQLVELLGGLIGVDSEPGIGSTFWVLLPLVEAREPVPPVPPKPQEWADHTGRTILVAEDNPINQMVVSRLLDQLGYEVDVVADGAEAVNAVGRRAYDAVLMDLNMPEMDGAEATRRIRAMGDGLPIIALTASALESDRDRCLDAGMTGVLTKPVRAPDVAEMLEALIGEPAARPTPTGSADGNDALLDEAAFTAIAEMYADADDMRELVSAYAGHARSELEQLAVDVANERVAEVQARCHRLAGSSSTLGGARLAARLREAEDDAREARLTADPGALGALLEETVAALHERLDLRTG